MPNKKILFTEVNKVEEDIANIANETGLEVIQSSNSFEIIQWVKSNGTAALIIINEESSPLNAYQTQSYIRHELDFQIPFLILVETDKLATVINNNTDPLLFFSDSIKDAGFIKDIIKKTKGFDDNDDEKPYSLEYLKMISEGNEKFIFETLQLFKSSVKIKLDELKAVADVGEIKNAGEIAHNIKPSFEMLGSETGREICDDLCYRATGEEIPGLVTRLNDEYVKIVTQLEIDFPLLKEK